MVPLREDFNTGFCKVARFPPHRELARVSERRAFSRPVMRARAAEGKSERESIMNEAPEDVRSSKSLRDGAMPCCVLTLLLVAAAGLGAAAVWLSLAAFDPEHSTSSLVLLSKPVPGAVHNATATATSGSDDKSSSGSGGGGGGGRRGFRSEAASIDDETWQVTAILANHAHLASQCSPSLTWRAR